jgi:hypothetical protein
MKYQIDGNRLLVSQPDGSSKEASFNWPIVQVLEIAEVLIVRVEPKTGACDNQNVFGVGTDASVLWQVVEQQHIYDDSPYTGLSIVDEGVMLSNWDGTDLVVSPTTGDVISQSQGK